MQVGFKCDNKNPNLKLFFYFVLNGVGCTVKLVSYRIILKSDVDSFPRTVSIYFRFFFPNTVDQWGFWQLHKVKGIFILSEPFFKGKDAAARENIN